MMVSYILSEIVRTQGHLREFLEVSDKVRRFQQLLEVDSEFQRVLGTFKRCTEVYRGL